MKKKGAQRRRTRTSADPPSAQLAQKKDQDEEEGDQDVDVVKSNKVDVEISVITFGSSLASSVSHPIGPIARMNCREQTIADEDGTLYQSTRLLGVPFKERVQSHIKDSGEGAPCLELNPFSPYSPGILNLESTIAFNHQTDNHKSVDLHDFVETVDFGRDETFDYIGQALGSSHAAAAAAAIDEPMILEHVLVETAEETEEEEVGEEHVLVVHLEENSTTLAQATPVDVIVAVAETIVDETHGSNAQPALEIVQEDPQPIQAAPVNLAAPIDLPGVISEVHLVTAVSIETFESKETPSVAELQHSTSQLIQRHDGSMVMHGFPHEPLHGSQLLEK
ncbi:hypothetical protein BGW39_006428 [Mortierella sp. 14UC]|nr:hypothetical protein BGW39_006428 [Mortierella sp. 14UC]